MKRGLLAELRLARHWFAALAALLLVLPLLFSIAPRPSQAATDYISSVSGYTLCSPLGAINQRQKQVPQSPCEDCLSGGHGLVGTANFPHIIAILHPPRLISGTLQHTATPPQPQSIAAIDAARGPPFLS